MHPRTSAKVLTALPACIRANCWKNYILPDVIFRRMPKRSRQTADRHLIPAYHELLPRVRLADKEPTAGTVPRDVVKLGSKIETR